MFSGNGPAVRKNVELARRVLSMRLIETVHAEPRDSVDQPSYRVNFWQWSGEAFLNDNMREVLVTLEGKRMCVESIFTECIDGVDYLYWYTVQGQGGDAVENSEHWIDKKHIEYWQACIDKAYPAVDLLSRVTMIPDRVRQAMR